MKKILFITNNWLTDYGGKRTALTKIINHLPKSKFDITVFDFETGVASKKDVGLDKDINLLTHFSESNARLPGYLKRLSKINKYDAIVCSGSPYLDIISIMAIKTLKLFGKTPVVLFCHTHPLKAIEINLSSLKSLFARLGYYFLAHSVYRFFDKIVVPGQDLRDFFVSRLGVKPAQISIINYPISDGHIHKLKEPNNHVKTLVTAARLVLVQKDFPTLFKALKEVNVKLKCRLNILGEGISRKPIEELATRLGVSGQVKFLGFKKNPIDYIKKSDLFVLSSTFEGCPISLVEAMASGVPVVSSDCDYGPMEILENGKNGLLVPVGNHQAMAEAVVRILENDDLKKRLIRNGLDRAKFYSEKKSYLLWNKLLTNGL